MGRKNLTYLILIIVLGAVLRFTFLSWNPPALNWDEVSHGYNAYSILKTGMDQWGQRLPFFNFRAYGDYPTTLNLYLTIPFIALFGLTEFSIRFPHAILGVLTIISVYFLAFGITKRRDISLFSSFLTAISPWYVFTSRFVLQSNLSVFFLITAAALFVNREKNKHFLSFSFISLFLTLFSYHTTRIFSPLLLIGTLLIYGKEISSKVIYVFAGIFILFSAYILINPGATARGNVLFLVDQGAVNKIIEARNSSKLPNNIKRIIYNRPVYFIENFSKNYISYFSPKFLFIKGGTQYQFSVPNFGLIYPVNLPFFYIGIIFIIAMALKDKNYRFLLLWLILSPIPASLTNESFAVIRATTMLPIPEILISICFFELLSKVKENYKFLTVSIYAILTFIFAESYIVNYVTAYRTNYSWSWQYGYKQAVDYVKQHDSEYDKIIVTKKYGEPHEYFLFYLYYNPSKYLNDASKITFFQSNWYWVDRFDKFYFVNDWQIKDLVTESKVKIDCKNMRCLLITSPGNYPKGWNKINAVNFLDGKSAFEIYSNFQE
ncbi:MAG TPA: phospholipid carrier-dependent glycosyltransferase [Patescibacteria group bacterium]|nr:phospholipid carrier-dependent glycosyltransferase [Patescibacteria group bacterium]